MAINLPEGYILDDTPEQTGLPSGYVLDQQINLPEGFILDKPEPESKELGTFPQRAYGAFMRGGMKLGEAVTALPGHIIRQAKLESQFVLAEMHQRFGTPERDIFLRQMKSIEGIYDKIADFVDEPVEIHKAGQRVIQENHPEWVSQPPKNFVDLLTSPDKLAISLVESTPLLVAAGILTAAGTPALSIGLMYTSEGQQAYDMAIADGRSRDEAESAFQIYGIVAAGLEQMQLQGILKIGKSAFKQTVNRTAQKVAKHGFKNLTYDVLKVAGQEAIEEMAQGTWQEATAKIVYDKSIPGGTGDFIDRRAQEGLIGFVMGVIPGAAGGLSGAAKGHIFSKEATEQIDKDTTLTPEEKVQHKQYIGDIQTKIVEHVVETFPEQVKDQESLERVGNAIAKELGMDPPTTWKWNTRKVHGYRGWHRARKEGHIINIMGGHVIFDPQRGAVAQKEIKETIVHELGHIAKPPTVKRARRSVHHQAFTDWVKENRGILETIRQEHVPLEEPAPQAVAEPTPAVEKKPARRKPKKYSVRKKLLKQGHVLPRKMGMTEVERRLFMKKTTGQVSMKKMSVEDMGKVIAAFEGEARARGIEIDQTELQELRTPVVVGGRTTTMEEVVDESNRAINALPSKVKVPSHIKRRFFKKIRRTGLTKKLGKLFYGIDSSPLYELTNILEQGKPGILTEVFSDNMQRGQGTSAAHKRTVANLFMRFCEDNNIALGDLAKISEGCNPRMFHDLLEAVGKGTAVHAITINDRTFDMTEAELLDIYLIARQEDGLRHIYGGGLVINGVKTSKLSEDTLKRLTDTVEGNPKLMQLVDIITSVEDIWKRSINDVSLTMEGKEIATIDNWWGLDVLRGRRLPGKEQKFNVNLIEDKGILKDRTKANNPLIVRDALQRFTSFENAIAEYVGMSEPTRIARTILNDDNLIELLRSKGYSDVYKNIQTIMERAQSVPPTSGSFDRLIRTAIPGIYRGVLFANPRVIASQYTSVTNYQAFVSAKYAVLAAKGMSPQAIERTLGLSDIAWDRFYMGHSSLELGELAASDATLRLLAKTSSDKNKLGVTLRVSDMAALAAGMEMAIAEYTDAQNGTITGESARYWTDKDTSFEDGSKKNWETETSEEWKMAVRTRAEWLWQHSQPSWDKWNRSVITSDPSSIKKLFFLFRSFHEKSLTILHGAHTEYTNSNKTIEDKTRYAKKYGAVLSGYTLNTILRAVIMAGLAFKIKDPFDYLKDIITAPFAMLPILGHVLDGSIRSFLNALTERRSEYRGEAIESLPVTVINEITHAPINFTQAAGYYLDGDTEKGNKSLKRGVAQLYSGIGLAMGIPVYELKRLYGGWIEEEEEGKKRGYGGVSEKKGYGG